MSIPKIKEVGPSFKADDEHFHTFIMKAGRYIFWSGMFPGKPAILSTALTQE
jgi:hypothetical protein